MKPEQDPETRPYALAGFLFKTGTPQSEMDAVVWSAFQSGDRKALDYIFQKHVKLLYVYGNKISSDRGLVEDCIQDLFVELWQKRNVLSPIRSIKYYLLKSLRRRILRRLKEGKLTLMPMSEQNETIETSESSAEMRLIERQLTLERQQRLERAMSALSKRQREAVYLKFYEKVPYDELAEIMDLTVKSAYNLVGKAVDNLRKALSK